MISFSRPMRAQIRAGKKTQTRRLVKGRRPPGIVGTIARPCFYKIGAKHQITKGRGKPGIGVFIQITDEPHREPLGAITDEDARREGFVHAIQFKDYWVKLHDGKWIAKVEAQRRWDAWILLCYGMGSEKELRDTIPVTHEQRLKRFEKRWAHKAVWVISFELTDPPPLLLAPSASPDGPDAEMLSDAERTRLSSSPEAHGYTGNPIRAIDELEVVTAERGSTTDDALTPGQRFDQAVSAAKARGEDTTGKEAAVLRKAKSLERKEAA